MDDNRRNFKKNLEGDMWSSSIQLTQADRMSQEKIFSRFFYYADLRNFIAHKKLFLLLFLLLFISLPSAVRSDSPSEIARRAQAGDRDAELLLGQIYEAGLNVNQDPALAAFWFKKAAEKGSSVAQTKLGLMYASGSGVPKNEVQALSLFQKAAEAEDPIAELNLGNFYDKGRGVPQDDVQAAYWYRRSADAGNPIAAFNLWLLYSQGRGVHFDISEAASWYRKAAKSGDPDALTNLATLYLNGDGVVANSVLAHAYMQIAASRGSAMAQQNLAETELWKRILSPSQQAEATEIATSWRTGLELPVKTKTGGGIPFVTVENKDTLKITGEIKPGALSRIEKEFSENIKYIVVNSGGGSAYEGLGIAKFIKNRNITVIVDGICFSACANYVFLFGDKRIIRENSVVCFHGGLPRGAANLALFMKANSAFVKEQDRGAFEAELRHHMKEQYFLLRERKIDPSILDYIIDFEVPNFVADGTGLAMSEYIKGKALGWCPRKEEFQKYGVTVDEMWYPNNARELIDLGHRYGGNLILVTDRHSQPH